jgi:hypothetical protein
VVPALLATALPAGAAAQGRVTAAQVETRRLSAPLEREVRSLTGSRAELWLAYRLPAAPGTHQRCGGSHVVLESSPEVIVMARLSAGAITQLRAFTPECDVDAGAVRLTWLEGVAAGDSASWLSGLVRSRATDRGWMTRVESPALNALAMQAGDAAVTALVTLAREDPRPAVRSRALGALAARAGEQPAAALAAAVDSDPEIEVKRTAIRGLARLPDRQGVPMLIDIARDNRNAALRREAMLQLGESNDPRAVRFFEDLLK